MFLESLDQLESITVPLFENIPNKHVEKLTFSYEQHPWGQEQLRRKIYAAISTTPSADNNGIIRLHFRVPDVRPQYKTGVSPIRVAWTQRNLHGK
mgnify:CR=1 FL=1